MAFKNLNQSIVLAIFISFVSSQTVLTDYNDTKQENPDSYYPTLQWSDSFDWKLLKVK